VEGWVLIVVAKKGILVAKKLAKKGKKAQNGELQ